MSEETKKTKESKAETAAEAPAADIVFVGKRRRLNKETGKYKLFPREAPPFIQDGADKIKLPEPEAQKDGFYHEDAARIIALFPDDYKIFKPKGDSQ